MHHRAKDIRGLKVGYLTAESYAGSDGRKSLWWVRCVCGRRKQMAATEVQKMLKRSVQASCGCRRGEKTAARNRTHGMSQHPAFAVWRSMLARCQNPKHRAWKNYGGRGVTVCERWQDFAAFWADMQSGYVQGLSLDRIDNNAGYCRENCRWATYTQQARNRRANRRIQTPWGEMTVSEAAKRAGLKVNTLLYRLVRGCPQEKLFTPADVRNRFTTS